MSHTNSAAPLADLDSVAPRAGQKRKLPLARPASFDDYDQIAAVQTANGLSVKPREEWRHLWQNNPAYQRVPGWPIGWVLEDERGCVVGSLENIPCLYRLGGRTYLGAFGRGWAVDVRYRACSLQLLACQMQQPNVDLRVTNTASAKTAALLTRLGWLQTPVGRWDQSALWIASYAQAIRSCLAATAPSFLSSLTGPAVCSQSLPQDALTGRRVKLKTVFELRWKTAFDGPFDEFWAALETQNPSVLLPNRSRRTLQWHYRHGLRQNRIWILTACDGPRIVAYAIFERKAAKSGYLTKAVLVDFQALVKDGGLCSSMIACTLQRCRMEGVPVMENVGCWLEAVQPLRRRAPLRRGLGGWCYFYQAANPSLARVLQSAGAWYPTQYDADASL